MSDARYVVSDDVEHGCCYSVSVIDTDNDLIVAECAEEHVAVRLAEMLNASIAA